MRELHVDNPNNCKEDVSNIVWMAMCDEFEGRLQADIDALMDAEPGAEIPFDFR